MRSLIFALALVLGAGLAHADATIPTKDEDGSRDHPLLKRYEGSLIVNYETKAYDELTVPLSTLKLTEDEEVATPTTTAWSRPTTRSNSRVPTRA
jgi:hypothetical protein